MRGKAVRTLDGEAMLPGQSCLLDFEARALSAWVELGSVGQSALACLSVQFLRHSCPHAVNSWEQIVRTKQHAAFISPKSTLFTPCSYRVTTQQLTTLNYFKQRQKPLETVDDFISLLKRTASNWAFGQIELVRVYRQVHRRSHWRRASFLLNQLSLQLMWRLTLKPVEVQAQANGVLFRHKRERPADECLFC